MRCETATIWIQICGERKAFQTVAFCGRSLGLQSSKGTLLCVILLGMVVGVKSSQGAYSGMACNWGRTRCCKLTSLQHC